MNSINSYADKLQFCLKISEGPSRPPVNRQATLAAVATHRLRTVDVGGPFLTRKGDGAHNQTRSKCSISAVGTDNKSDRSTWQTVTSRLARSIEQMLHLCHFGRLLYLPK